MNPFQVQQDPLQGTWLEWLFNQQAPTGRLVGLEARDNIPMIRDLVRDYLRQTPMGPWRHTPGNPLDWMEDFVHEIPIEDRRDEWRIG